VGLHRSYSFKWSFASYWGVNDRKNETIKQSLIQDFSIKPKIAVLGLNPHCAMVELIGNEENLVLKPVLKNIW
jgi:4-hydroxythreonine-4-phosphate dehydrogenase